MSHWHTEETSIGRVLVPASLPDGFAVFCTTADFRGRITGDIATELMDVVRTRWSIDASLSTCHQVHGAHVVRAERKGEWDECSSCDALWSDEPGSALGIKIADCLPVSFVEPKHGVIANVHAGWRGVAQKIPEAAIHSMKASSGFESVNTHVYLGPSIRACCFEVGEEVVADLERVYGGIEPFVDRTRAKPHVDLAGIVTRSLVEQGVPASQIDDSGICTRCDDSIFHSYRRDPEGGGRNLMIVARR